MCICRIGQNVPAKSPVADIDAVESQQPALQDDHDYSTFDDVQQQTLAVSDDSAYEFLPDHDHELMQEDDQAYVNIDISQQVIGRQGYSTASEAAASNK